MILQAFPFLAQAAEAAPQAPGGPSFQMVTFAFLGIIFYFLLIRPQQKKAKEMQKLVSSLKTGDKVVTSSGIHGIVSNVKDGATLILKIADNVKIEIDKSSITTIDSSSAA